MVCSEAPGQDTTSTLTPQENEEGEEGIGMEKGATTLGDLTQDEVRARGYICICKYLYIHICMYVYMWRRHYIGSLFVN